MRRHSKYICWWLSIALWLSACQKGHRGDCFKSTGDVVTEIREPEAFSRLEISAWFHEVELIDTNFHRLEITMGEHLLDGIHSEVIDGKLFISDRNVCNWVRDYRKERTLKIYGSPRYIWQDGDGTFVCNNFKQDSLYFYLTGGDSKITLNTTFLLAELYQTGSLSIEGSCRYYTTSVNAFGSFRAYDCATTTAIMNHTGEGNAFVRAKDTLGVSISSVGNVYYQGSPNTILLNDNGPGELIGEN